MADVKTVDEGELLDKRKLDLPKSINKGPEDEKDRDDSSKRQKIEAPAGENCPVSLADGEDSAKAAEPANVVAFAEDDEDDDEDEEEYNAEEDGDGEAENVDRKGKGIMVDRKGKGKMIEDSDDDDSEGLGEVEDDDDDSSDDSDSDFSDGLDGSDLEEDPLAEVDLDNILPSRTRRSRAQSGVWISNDTDKAFKYNDPGCFLCLPWAAALCLSESELNSSYTMVILKDAEHFMSNTDVDVPFNSGDCGSDQKEFNKNIEDESHDQCNRMHLKPSVSTRVAEVMAEQKLAQAPISLLNERDRGRLIWNDAQKQHRKDMLYRNTRIILAHR